MTGHEGVYDATRACGVDAERSDTGRQRGPCLKLSDLVCVPGEFRQSICRIPPKLRRSTREMPENDGTRRKFDVCKCDSALPCYMYVSSIVMSRCVVRYRDGLRGRVRAPNVGGVGAGRAGQCDLHIRR